MSSEDITEASSQSNEPTTGRRFKSYRLNGEYEKTWLGDPALKKTRLNNIIVGCCILLGWIGAGLAIFFLTWPYRPEPVSLPELKRGIVMCMVFSHIIVLHGL
jgi:hypothetical protein